MLDRIFLAIVKRRARVLRSEAKEFESTCWAVGHGVISFEVYHAQLHDRLEF
jgi:hypothetical protein